MSSAVHADEAVHFAVSARIRAVGGHGNYAGAELRFAC
jgi:hypothetical protein